MDELVGMLFEQVSRKLRESPRPPAPSAPPVVRAGPPKPVVATPQPPPPRPSRRDRPPQPPPPPDPFALAPSEPQPAARNRLLIDFASANGLLAGIVLGEALAPPLSLREREPGRS